MTVRNRCSQQKKTGVQTNHVILVTDQVHTRNADDPLALVWLLYVNPCMVVKQSRGYFAELCIIHIINSHMAPPGWGFLMCVSLDAANSIIQPKPLHS